MGDTLPKKGVKCHRTFSHPKGPIDCRTMVCDHGCQLWKRVTLEGHPETAVAVDHYECVDSLVDLYLKDMLRRQLQTTATVDTLRKEVRDANDIGMANALVGLNREMQRLDQQDQAALPNGAAPAPKLLEG